MQLSQLRDLLTEYVNDDSTQRWTDATRNRYLNIWYKKILTEEPWYFLTATDTSITTSTSTSSYAKPSGMQKILGVWLGSVKPSNKLSEITRKEREVWDLTANARPQYYFLMGDNIYIYPLPDAAYNLTIEYIRQVPDMSSDSDTPAFDSDFHYLIPLGAAASLKKTSGGSQINEAEDLVQEYLAGLDRMRKQLGQGTDDRPLAVKNVWDLYQRDDFNYT